MRLHNVKGGFTDQVVDAILTDARIYGNNYTPEQNAHHYQLLRAFPHSDNPRRQPIAWARVHAARALQSGLAGIGIPVPASIEEVVTASARPVSAAAAPVAAAAAPEILFAAPAAAPAALVAPQAVSYSSSSSDSESDEEWVLSHRRVERMSTPIRLHVDERSRDRSLSPPRRTQLSIDAAMQRPGANGSPVYVPPPSLPMATPPTPNPARWMWTEALLNAPDFSMLDEEADVELQRVLELDAREASAAAHAPAPAVQEPADPEAGDEECTICGMENRKLFPVSFLCNHSYCARCIIQIFASAPGGLKRCPGCVLNTTAEIRFNTVPQVRETYPFLFLRSVGVIDPHMLRRLPQLSDAPKLEPLLRSGVQLDAFFPSTGSVYFAGAPSKCPHCRQRITGTPCSTTPNITRCTSATCGAVFCTLCSRDWSRVHVCQAPTAEDVASVQVVSRTSKPCPNCNAPVTHYLNHGCHRMHCTNHSCGHRFCYVCLAVVRADEDDPNDEALDRQTCRCPPFCQADGACGCIRCPDCRPGEPCPAADRH